MSKYEKHEKFDPSSSSSPSSSFSPGTGKARKAKNGGPLSSSPSSSLPIASGMGGSVSGVSGGSLQPSASLSAGVSSSLQATYVHFLFPLPLALSFLPLPPLYLSLPPSSSFPSRFFVLRRSSPFLSHPHSNHNKDKRVSEVAGVSRTNREEVLLRVVAPVTLPPRALARLGAVVEDEEVSVVALLPLFHQEE